jgi:tripartite-type tricarboxylate transporter receptor subunit TctC
MLGRRQFVGAIGVAGVAAPFVARSQAWPPSRVTVVVPFPAGAATDIGACVYAEQLTTLWGQPVVVDNKGGGNGIPAADSVVRAKPDGLTIFATSAMTQQSIRRSTTSCPTIRSRASRRLPGSAPTRSEKERWGQIIQRANIELE